MKRKTLIILSLLTTLAAGAQTINVHMTDGTVVTYPSADVEFIDFTAKEDNIPSYTTCPDENHPHLIDLGLPSGTKWACCNVGASEPEQYGNYYAWGETQPKSVYNSDTYAYYQNRAYVDIGSDIAGTGYDTATANWGDPWRMPSLTQCRELIEMCTSVWTTQNGVKGAKLTGPNGGTIFFPAAGDRLGSELYATGSRGYYWSSTLGQTGQGGACGISHFKGAFATFRNSRSTGFSVRPVYYSN